MGHRAPEKAVTISKWGGDDRYSWAVFVRGRQEPVVSGLSREEARYHAGVVARQVIESRSRQP